MIDNTIISKYLSGKYELSDYYKRCNALRNKMLPHSKGEYPELLENLTRPGETQEQKDYRRNVWSAITYPSFLQINTQVEKLRRSKGFGILFPNDYPRIIKPEQDLQSYLLKNYPNVDNIFNHLFEKVRPANVEDSNGVIAVYPKEYNDGVPINANTYLSPFAFVYSCKEVLEYSEGKYCVIQRKDKVKIKSGESWIEGNVYVFIDSLTVTIATQTGANGDANTYNLVTYPHFSGSVPVWKLGSNIVDEEDVTQSIYLSPIEAFRIHADKALMRFSDVDIQYLNHVHSERVQYGHECKDCKGTGKIADHTFMGQKRPSFHECGTCGGIGKTVPKVGAQNTHIYNMEATRVGDIPSFPPSPVSYVNKPTEPTTMLEESYKYHIQEGFRALGLAYMNETPLNESGKKAEYDRQEINTFFYGEASRLMWHLRYITWYTNEQRYFFVNPKERVEYYNQIQFKVPESFDVLSTEYYQMQYQNSLAGNESPIVTGEKAKEYARKEFGEASIKFNKLSDAIDLDPYPGLKEVEKIDLLATDPNNLNIIISQQLEFFLNMAYDDNPNFFDLKLKDKFNKLKEYAQEVVTAKNKQLVRPNLDAVPVDADVV